MNHNIVTVGNYTLLLWGWCDAAWGFSNHRIVAPLDYTWSFWLGCIEIRKWEPQTYESISRLGRVRVVRFRGAGDAAMSMGRHRQATGSDHGR